MATFGPLLLRAAGAEDGVVGGDLFPHLLDTLLPLDRDEEVHPVERHPAVVPDDPAPPVPVGEAEMLRRRDDLGP